MSTNWGVRTGGLISYKAVSDMASRLLSFGVVILSARFLPAEAFGVFSLAWAAGWILSVGSDCGLQIFLTREVSRRPQMAFSTFRTLLPWRVMLAVLLTLVAAGILISRPSVTDYLAVALIVVSQLFTSFIEFLNYFFRGLERSELESSLNLLHRAAGLLLSALWLWRAPELLSVASALFLASLLALVSGTLIYYRLLLRSRGDREPSSLRPRDILIQLAPLGLGILLSALYFRIDLFFLDRFHGAEEVGLYNAVFRLIDALRLFPAAVMAVLFPEMVRNRGGVLRWSMTGLTLLSLILAAAIYWQSEWVILICYGPAYTGALGPFRILIISLPPLFANFVLTHQLVGSGHDWAYALTCAAGLLCALLLNGLLVPAGGMEGSAWACLVRELMISAICVYVLWRRR